MPDYEDQIFAGPREDPGENAEESLNWTEEFILTDAEAERISDPEWIIPNLIIQGHVIAIPAPPNGGKTTILAHLSGVMVAKGYRVFYVNADVSSGDAKPMKQMADRQGWKLLLPDMKVGLSMDSVVFQLEETNRKNADYSDVVFIFDTLKKMTNVINKSRAKELYKTLRGLSAKGMTIVLLAHTNKYTDENGRPIYEGTADLRSDVDEMIYMIPQRREDGGLTVSTDPDKVRGKFEPLTFFISPDRTVTQAEVFIDVAYENKRAKQKENDLPVIAAIDESIESGKTSQTDIIEYCRGHGGFGRRPVVAVLKRWSRGNDRIWSSVRGFQNNRIDYAKVLPCTK